MRDLLVTGTDTGIGKTVVAAALIRALRQAGIRAVGFKPVETGVRDAETSDAEVLSRAAGEPISGASPLLSLTESLAPAVAAERAGLDLSFREIETRLGTLRSAGWPIVVEGAGGVTVPLLWKTREGDPYTVLDLAERCGLDALVVGRAGLGTINHMVMTVAMLRGRRIPVKMLILNGRSATVDRAEATNASTLARLVPDVPIVEIPRHPSAADPVEASVAYLSAFAAAQKGAM